MVTARMARPRVLAYFSDTIPDEDKIRLYALAGLSEERVDVQKQPVDVSYDEPEFRYPPTGRKMLFPFFLLVTR